MNNNNDWFPSERSSQAVFPPSELRSRAVESNKSLRDTIRDAFKDETRYKFIDKGEATIASIDEHKQLRSDFFPDNYGICLHFRQGYTKEYFTPDEFNYLTAKLKRVLDTYVRFEIRATYY